MAVTPFEYEYLRRLLKARIGLALGASTRATAASRFAAVARRGGLSGVGDLVQRLRGGDDEALQQVIEAVTSRETWFFRDRALFDACRDTLIPTLQAARRRQRALRILSIGCGGGQEPYSLAMTLSEMGAALEGWRIGIVAADVSAAAIDKARRGVYSQSEVQRGLPIRMLLSHFAQDREQEPASWRIGPDIRAMVTFRTMNLASDIAEAGAFDLVFCRNVLRAFDPAAKLAALGRLKGLIAPDGFLALGADETMVSMIGGFAPIPACGGLYRSLRARTTHLALVAG